MYHAKRCELGENAECREMWLALCPVYGEGERKEVRKVSGQNGEDFHVVTASIGTHLEPGQ